MKEHPIIMQAESVRAILNGTKTQTRRVIKGQPEPGCRIGNYSDNKSNIVEWVFADSDGDPIDEPSFNCSYGVIGDHLWVKEMWRTGGDLDAFNATQIREFAQEAGYAEGPYGPLWYSGGVYRTWGGADMHDFGKPGKKRNSRFMPRWASRITLEITVVRVERVQDISEEDAKAEGVDAVSMDAVPRGAVWSRRQDFAQLWDLINAKRGYSWDKNLWCWVIEFRRISDD